MESIKVAIERAKQAQLGVEQRPQQQTSIRPARTNPQLDEPKRGTIVSVDTRRLREMRILAYDTSARQTPAYDMLRTQVLQGLRELSYKTLAITSPSPGCGKTVTSINLAFSIARQVEERVLLIDLDLRKPQIAHYLGLELSKQLDQVVSGDCNLVEALVVPNLAGRQLSVLAMTHSQAHPSELISSPAMRSFIERLKNDPTFSTIIFDVPPMLSSDDFLALLPQVDCALLVAEGGRTSSREIRECERLIDERKFFGCILNKAESARDKYEYY